MGIFFAKELGIDMGSAYTRIADREHGVLLCEPTVAAISMETGMPEAAGADAVELLRYAPDRYKRAYPIRDGMVQQQHLVIYVLRSLLHKAFPGKRGGWSGTLCIPCGLNERQYAAWEYCANMAGIRKVAFIEEPLAAALGQGWDVYSPYGRMAISLGAGSIRGAVTSYAGIVAYAHCETGGTQLDALIVRHIAKAYGLQIGSGTAERIKLALGAQSAADSEGMYVAGHTHQEGTMRDAMLYPAEFGGVLTMQYRQVLEVVKTLFGRISPEVLSDIAEEGILLYGGNALLYGLQQYLQVQTGVPIIIAKQPLYAAVMGACTSVYSDARRIAR